MNTYACFYRGKQIQVTADTQYAAQLAAARVFKARRSYDVTVYLVGRGKYQYVHSTGSIG